MIMYFNSHVVGNYVYTGRWLKKLLQPPG